MYLESTLRFVLEGYIFWGQNLPIRRPHNFFLKQKIKIKMKIPVNSKFPKIITQTIHKLNSQRKLRLSRSLCTRVGIRASLHTRIRDRMHTCQIRASWHKRLGFGDKLFASAQLRGLCCSLSLSLSLCSFSLDCFSNIVGEGGLLVQSKCFAEARIQEKLCF